ncbi:MULTISPECIES: hypothetical protein [Microbacterium]|uniref:hypothetical protein n=1 Tax=Microbacterium TaxID=33882 RepID=UPI000D649E5D|nr:MULTISPECIES: hypothetical protein [Microbacterium]
MTRNPWAVALWATGGLSLVIAFMLTVVTWQLVDNETYDVAGVASIEGWVRLLVAIAAAAFTGAVVLSGVQRMLRLGTGPLAGTGRTAVPGYPDKTAR